MLAGSPVHVDDLDDGAYVLAAATLPREQICADAVTGTGLRALGIPDTYPQHADGTPVEREECQAIGRRLRERGLRGIWCRSAALRDSRGRELAWFPATARSRARALWNEPLPFGSWRHASRWADLGLDEQPDPSP